MHLAADAMLPLCGVVFANAKCLSPLKSVLRARSEETLGNLNALPLVAVTGNNAGWAAHSITASHDPYVLAGTMPGLFLGMYYIISCYVVSSEDQACRRANGIAGATAGYTLALGAAGLLTFVPGLNISPGDAFGTLSMSLLMLFYLSPLPTMLDALRQRSAACIHAPLAAATFCNAALWFTYALSQGCWHMWVPHGVGVILAAAQLALVAAHGDNGDACALPPYEVDE
jgi:hypothetical protein